MPCWEGDHETRRLHQSNWPLHVPPSLPTPPLSCLQAAQAAGLASVQELEQVKEAIKEKKKDAAALRQEAAAATERLQALQGEREVRA